MKLNTLIATVDTQDVNIKARVKTLEDAGFLSDVPPHFITEAELAAEGFLVSSDLTGYATEIYVTNAIAAIPGNRPHWVCDRDICKPIAISAIPSTDLTGYATEAWVQAQGYGTGTGGGITLTDVTNAGFIKLGDISGDLDVDKVYFKNVFSNLSDLPSATTYHGMFAHVHATGKAYYAHGGKLD